MTAWSVWGPGDPHLVAQPGSRDAARRSLAEASLNGEAQRACRRRFEQLVADHSDALDRTCRPGHLTGSALVVEHGADRVLVLWHNKARRWLQPGGHADGDGNLAHVAWREATEETGIEGLAVVSPAVHVDIHEFRPPDEDPHLHYDIRFVVLAPAHAQPVANHESGGLRWVTLDELAGLDPDEGLVDLAERGLAVARALPAGLWPEVGSER